MAFVGHNDGFELQNARVGVTGKLGTRVAFVVSFDGAVDERAQVNAPQGNLAVGLRDAFVDFRVKASSPLFIRAGYFQTLTDPEALVPDTSREFVDRPLESLGVPATEGYQTPGLPPGRSQGVALRYDPNVGRELGIGVGFELAAQNGADEFSSNNDNNSLALSASGLVALPRGGWLVASVRYNPASVGMLPFRQDEDVLQGMFGAHFLAGPVSLSGGLVLQQTTFPTTGGPTSNAYGGHAQAMVRLYASRAAPSVVALWLGYRLRHPRPVHADPDQPRDGPHCRRPARRATVPHAVPGAGRGDRRRTGRQFENDRIQLAAEVVF